LLSHASQVQRFFPNNLRINLSIQEVAMSVEFGLHRNIGTAEQLNKLVADLGPKQRAVAVVLGNRQWGVRVIPTPNKVLEFINRLSGQTKREQQGLIALEQRLSAFDTEGRYGADGAGGTPNASRLTQTQAAHEWVEVSLQSHANAPAPELPIVEKDLPRQPASLPAAEISKPATVAKVQQYVEAQDGGLCLKHSIAAYFNRPVFSGREDFIAFRNECYDDLAKVYGDMYAEQADYARDETNVPAVSKVLEKIRSDPRVDKKGIDIKAPWSELFEISVKRERTPLVDPSEQRETHRAIDAQFERFAKESASHRFIVRTGSGAAGHYWFLSHDPNSKLWTVANSTGMRVEQGQSPAALLDHNNVRRADIFLWTQVMSDPMEVQQRCQTEVIDGKPKQHIQTPAELEAERLNLPPPIIRPRSH